MQKLSFLKSFAQKLGTVMRSAMEEYYFVKVLSREQFFCASGLLDARI